VAALTDGRFVTVYQADDSLKARFLSVTLGQTFPLASSGAEIAVAGGTNVDFRPTVTQIAGGGFMVAFYSTNGTVSGRVYNSSGVLQGATFVIANLSADGAVVGDRDIAITTLTNGDVVVAWTGTQGTAGLQSPETATSGTYVDFKVFNPAVIPGQAGFLVTQASADPRLDGATTVFAGNQFDPALTALADGRFVLGFTDQSGGSQSGGDDASGLALRGQIFDLRTAGVTIGGTAGNDQYFGSDFTDVISGGNGDDDLSGGAGGDALAGGSNTAAGDTLAYVFSSAGVSINLATNSAAGGAAQGDIITGFENVTGSGFADQLVGDGGANVLTGGADNDALNGGTGSDTVNGGTGQDTIIIGNGLNGDVDHIDGGSERDLLDLSSTTNGAIWIDFGFNLGPNQLFTFNSLASIVNMESMIGTAFGDTMRGDSGSNFIDGGAGADELLSYSAYDTVNPYASLGDVILGGAGNDLLFSGTGNDFLDGGADNDTIEVGGGTDTIVTGTGNDTILFSPRCGTDTITDFTGGAGVADVLKLYGFGTTFDTFAEVFAVSTQVGANTQIALTDTTIILQNFTRATLVADDFLFV
jgi:RTX calcium-binding nonapeptide repeat (4 copies)